MSITDSDSLASLGESREKSEEIPEWSVVVITRNEEAVIGNCLRSVSQGFAGYRYEVIVVDSASTDQTVAIARGSGARVIRLTNSVPLRPSVGRCVGLRASRGKWILFLDGDCVLDPAWLAPAAQAFKAEPGLAGVAGEMEHIPLSRDREAKRFVYAYPNSDYREADYLAGSAAYKREVLDIAGGFNPFLYASEEAELGARLRKHGYVLRRLRIPMTKHFYKYRGETVTELLRRIGRGYYVGMGQFVRYVKSDDLPIPKPYWTIHRHIEYFALLVLGVVALTVAAIFGKESYFLLWLGLLSLIFLVFALRSRSLRKPAYYFLEWTLTSPIVVWGVLKTPRSVEEFPHILTEDT